jgi:DNA polymerase-3 subunit beta
MILSIRRDQLRHAVQGLGRIISSRSTLPVLKAVRFDIDENGAAVQATDLDSIATYRFTDPSVRGQGTFITPLPAIKELTRGAGSDRVEFETTGEGQVLVTSPAAGQPLQRTLPTIEPEEWPDIRMDVDTAPVPGFLDVYRRLVPFASRDETRYVLNGVCLDVGGQGPDAGIMIATDGRRLASQNGMTLPFDTSILRLSIFLTWKQLPADAEVGRARINDVDWIGIEAGEWTFRTRAIEGSFPNWRQVVPSDPGGRRMTLAEQDVDILREAIPSLPGEETITLAGNDGRVTVYARGSDDEGWTSLELPHATFEGEPGHISLNRKYVGEAMAAGFMRSIRFADELSPAYSEDGEGGMHLLMCMRAEVPENIEKVAAEDEGDSEGPTDQGESPAETKPPSPPPNPSSPDDPSKKRQQAPDKGPSRPTHPEPTRRKSPMSDKSPKPDDLAAFAELQAATGEVKTKLQETKLAVTRLTGAVKAAMKDARQQRAEVEAARATLAKLKTIDL